MSSKPKPTDKFDTHISAIAKIADGIVTQEAYDRDDAILFYERLIEHLDIRLEQMISEAMGL